MVPDNTAFYQTQIDLTQTNGYYVDVSATIDERTGIATWVFTTIDPTTGGFRSIPPLASCRRTTRPASARASSRTR